MENNTNQISSNYCKRNCGFFGNQAFDGYCSKCYKEHVKRQNSGTAAGRVTPTSVSLSSESSSNLSAAAAAATPMEVVAATPVVQPIAPVTTTATTSTSNVTFNLGENIEIDNNNDNNNNKTPNENISTANSSNVLNNTLPECASSSSSLSSSNDGNEKKSKRTRCNVDTCRRKLGLTGFDCRCGNVYCWEHRYSDKHSCQFDYKELGQEQIRKNNPVVVGEKIQKI